MADPTADEGHKVTWKSSESLNTAADVLTNRNSMA
jgi:hypothetical protein